MKLRSRERVGIAGKAGQGKRAGSESADRGEEQEQRVKDAKEKEPEGVVADLQYETARHPLEDSRGGRGRGPGAGRAPVPSWATPRQTWRVGSAVCNSSVGTGRYDVCGQGGRVSTRFAWWKPSRASRHRRKEALEATI